MRRLLLIAALILVQFPLRAQVDSTRLAKLDSLLEEYYATMARLDTDTKNEECDYLIGSCRDSLTRQHVATGIYRHYVDSPIMGEESVAIHVYDRWFSDKTVVMADCDEQFEAGMFAEFNRNSLIGMNAPALELQDPNGKKVTIPVGGRTAVLYFFSTDCSKCKATTIILPHVLEEADFPLDVYTVCTNDDRKAWKEFRKNFTVSNPKVRITHLCDPEIDSDYQRLYGITSTPKLFLVEPQGTIIGRRLETESLMQLLPIAGAIQKMYEKTTK